MSPRDADTPLSAVTEPDGFDSSRESGLSAREAFFLLANPLELLRRYPESERGRVLREIERYQQELEAQRAPEQARWADAMAGRGHVSTSRAAELIVRARDGR